MKKRLAILTDAPTLHTGLGRVCKEVSRYLSKSYDVYCIGWHYPCTPYQSDAPYVKWIYPLAKTGDDYRMKSQEAKSVMFSLNHCKPEILLTIGDPWDFTYMPEIKAQCQLKLKTFRWVASLNIDGAPVNQDWSEIFAHADKVITHSHFGKKEIEDAFPDVKAIVNYHGVDSKVFKPNPDVYKKTTANTIGRDFKKTFIVFVNKQNTFRTNIPVAIDGFCKFAADKEDVFLFLNCNANDPNGPDLNGIVKYNEKKIPGTKLKVGLSNFESAYKGMSEQELADAYNYSDVLLNTVAGGGFELPILEAMSSGCEVIATDFTAPTELLSEDRGVLIKPGAYLTGLQNYKRAILNPEDVADALEGLYKEWKLNGAVTKHTKKAREFAKSLSWEICADRYRQELRELEQADKIIGSPTIRIIIPTRDNPEMLSRCLDTIKKNTVYCNYKVTIVDNLSKNERLLKYFEFIKKDKKLNAKVLKYEEEFNYSKANNMAVEDDNGSSDYYVFLNDDTIPLKGWLTYLLLEAQKKEVGIVGAKLLFLNKSIQHAGCYVTPDNICQHKFLGQPMHFVPANLRKKVCANTGACLMMRSELFREVEMFDEGYKTEWQDIDLCFKVREKGLDCIYAPLSVLFHEACVSRKKYQPGYVEPSDREKFWKRWKDEMTKNYDLLYKEL